jgi:hypothetical protein
MDFNELLFTDDLHLEPELIINKKKIPNMNQNACPICMQSGNMIDVEIPGNLFVRLECGNLVCNRCWNEWKLNGYKCPVCNKRSHREQEIVLQKEEFNELYSDHNDELVKEEKITKILEKEKRINCDFVPDPKSVRIEDIQVQIKHLTFDKKHLENEIMLLQMENDDFSSEFAQKVFINIGAIENKLKKLHEELYSLQPHQEKKTIQELEIEKNLTELHLQELKFENLKKELFKDKNQYEFENYQQQLKDMKDAKDKKEMQEIEDELIEMQLQQMIERENH